MDTLSNFRIPPFCHPKPLSHRFPSTLHKLTTPFNRNSFPVYLSPSTATKFQTFAHFRRPTTAGRRNSLRKKLLRDHQVRPYQIPNDPSSVSGDGVEENGVGVQEACVDDNVVEVEKAKSKLLGESVLWNKLENWVDQYKKDVEYWGVGSGPIFTVFHDSLGAVKRVSIDEEEILKRSRVRRDVIGDFPEVRSKILNAKNMAREMENGNNVIARNSSVAKFVVQGEMEGGFVKAVQGFVAQPGLVPKLSGVGRKVLYVLVGLWVVKKLFSFGDNKEVEYSEKEKEMMRRKMKARKEKEMLAKGAIEVIPEPSVTPVGGVKKPKLDKDQLRNNIVKAKASADKLVIHDSSAEVTTRSTDMDCKVQEIREMARRARRIEGRDLSPVNGDMKMEDHVIEKPSSKDEVIKKKNEPDNTLSDHQNEVSRRTQASNAILQTNSVDVAENIGSSVLHEVVPADERKLDASDVVVAGDNEINKLEIEFTENNVHGKGRENDKPSDTPINGSSKTNESSVKKKPRIIRSVKEAKDYLSKKRDKQDPSRESKTELVQENISDLKSSSVIDFHDQNLETNTFVPRRDTLNGISDSKPVINAGEDSNKKDEELSPTKNDNVKDSGIEPGLEEFRKSEITLNREGNAIGTETMLSVKPENWPEKNLHKEPIIENIKGDTLNGLSDSKPTTNPSEVDGGTEIRLSVKPENWPEENLLKVDQIKSEALNGLSDSKPATNPGEDSNPKDMDFGPSRDVYSEDSGVESGVGNPQKSHTTLDPEVNGISIEARVSGKTEKWLEKNFHEVEPLIKQIRAGFRNNYKAARERVDESLDIPTVTESLGGYEDSGELDWMQDDYLRDVVFRVRENELSGRDPFYMMDAEDKEAFFRGLEKKIEKENQNLAHVHEWLHSNIENLDYGADGISIYDPPEKIIPRWKGPPAEKVAEFLNEFLDNRKTSSTRNVNPAKKDQSGLAKKSDDSSLQEKVDSTAAPIKKLKTPKTVIEGSDGSVKAGKKSGKEFWQHTKKWSQGFLDSYNAETDPEIKSVMKDMGKDLDRWITEKEIEEAADLMNKLPEKNKSFMEKKLNKIKREMELFGPQAVVSKYREYADDDEEDYLWWLDLPHVLCIELYTVEDGEDKVGLYSLEMAADLELDPKPYHVIAFQDPGDCKNLCYIIQTHMEMLGNGHAFVVARPPKDAFREAKANGFGVTVIKKGELKLNIDQPLEEVEEQITEVGSKMYHDMMMKERSVDINSLMKGVFGFSERSIKRLKRKLKKSKKG